MIVKLIGTELRHEIECLGIDVMGEIGLSYGDNPHVRGHGAGSISTCSTWPDHRRRDVANSEKHHQ